MRLRGKTMVLCALLAVAPVAVAWLMGAYDAWTSWRYRGHLEDAATEIAARLESSAPAAEIAAVCREREVHARLVDPAGSVTALSDPRFGDGRFSRSGWFAALADFFHGPDGSPDLLDAEAELDPLDDRAEVAAALAGRASSTRRTTPSANAFIFYRSVPLAGGRALVVSRLSRRSARALYDHRYRLLKMTLLTLGLAVLVALWAGRSVVDPLATMQARVADHLDSGAALDLGVDRGDEIGDLARSFETLADRLRARAARAATASAELAHDLKSPIAAVLASAELLEDQAGDPARRQRIAAGIRRAAEHLERSLHGFMSLAELDETLLSRPRQPIDLAAVAGEVIEAIASRPQHAGVTFGSRLEPGAEIAGDRERVAQMIANLVDNAADFAAGRVEVAVRAAGSAAVIEVADDGPGVTGASRDRVFERFFSGRGPERGGRSGRGLGLAQAAAVAEAYGGRAELLNEQPLGGAAFRVTLPIRAAR